MMFTGRKIILFNNSVYIVIMKMYSRLFVIRCGKFSFFKIKFDDIFEK